MREPTWSVIRDRVGESHSTEYRGMVLVVSRLHAQAAVQGVVVIGETTPPERFSAPCTIDQAKARCIRIANRHADVGDV